jgi:hypothetical protein
VLMFSRQKVQKWVTDHANTRVGPFHLRQAGTVLSASKNRVVQYRLSYEGDGE